MAWIVQLHAISQQFLGSQIHHVYLDCYKVILEFVAQHMQEVMIDCVRWQKSLGATKVN